MKTILILACLLSTHFICLAGEKYADTTAIVLIRNVSPDPFSNQITVKVSVSADAVITATLTDISGRKVLQKNFSLIEGINDFQLITQALKPGNYLLEVRAGNYYQTRSIIKSGKLQRDEL